MSVCDEKKTLRSNISLQPKFQTIASFTESQLLLLEKYQSFNILLNKHLSRAARKKEARNGLKN